MPGTCPMFARTALALLPLCLAAAPAVAPPSATQPSTQPRSLIKVSGALPPEKPGGASDALTVLLDVNDAPDLKPWALTAADYAIKQYPVIAARLATDGFTPPRQFTIVFREMKGVANTARDRITVSAAYARAHPDDLGMIAHELTHVIQRYPRGAGPGWLTEGIADYVRYYVVEPGSKRARFNADRSNYDSGYQASAGFLNYLETANPGVVSKLNQALRTHTYTADTLKTLIGGDPADLWQQFKASLKSPQPK
jgi:hypothetical protein